MSLLLLFYVYNSKTPLTIAQPGKLKRKSSGGERAWFLEEESEPRN